MVLICIFLMTNADEHLFMWLFVIYLSTLVKCLFRPFAHFLIQLFISLLLGFELFKLINTFKESPTYFVVKLLRRI